VLRDYAAHILEEKPIDLVCKFSNPDILGVVNKVGMGSLQTSAAFE
jgi:hypothetical protein